MEANSDSQAFQSATTPLGSDGEKSDPTKRPRPNQKQRDNAPSHLKRPSNSQTDTGSFTEFENVELIGSRNELVRSGDDEARHDPESVTEVSYPRLSRGEGLRVMVSDVKGRDDTNDNF
jgi:hypothetical protein